jgi:MFS family permease
MTETTKKPLITGQLLIFLVGMFFVEASFSMTTVQVPVFLRELGADIRQIGLFFTISLIFPLLLRILGGWISDTIGRLRALQIGSVVGVSSYVVFALAPSWQVALIAPAAAAISTALWIPSYYAYIADHTSEEGRGLLSVSPRPPANWHGFSLLHWGAYWDKTTATAGCSPPPRSPRHWRR